MITNKNEIFDAIEFSNTYQIKVKKNGLFGYFQITDIKYKTLNKFEFNLASFVLSNGQKGFIDAEGTEYLQ